MGIWQIVYIGLISASLGMHLVKSGEPKTGRYSFGSAFVAAVIQIGILYFGGFFN